ncbi:TPA: hypothetical protein ACRGOB_005499, partial [Klebsiella pneumoniae]|nr:hypothetical protein [Klebsiella pneumoniae]
LKNSRLYLCRVWRVCYVLRNVYRLMIPMTIKNSMVAESIISSQPKGLASKTVVMQSLVQLATVG